MRLFFAIVYIQLIELTAYPFHFFARLLLGGVPVAVTMLVWNAIYRQDAAVALDFHMSADEINCYLLMANFTFMALSFDYYAISEDIRSGRLNDYLLRPVAYFHYRLYTAIAAFAANLMFLFVPMLLVVGFFDVGMAGLGQYLLLLVLSMLLYFVLMYSSSLLAFWYLEVSAFFAMFQFISAFLAGTMVPLHLLPSIVRQASAFLPFRYLGYENSRLLLTELPWQQFALLCLEVSSWIAFFLVVASMLWKRGLKRYAAFGN